MHLCMQVNRPRLKRRRTCRSCLRQPEDTLVGACKKHFIFHLDHATDRLPLQSGKRQSCTFFPRIKPLRHTQPQTVFVIKQHIIQYRRRQVISQVHTQLERVRQFVVCIDFSILQCNPDNTLLITHHGSGRLDIAPGINHSVQLVMLDFIPVITIYPDMSIHPDKSGRILVYLEYLPTAQSLLDTQGAE